MKETNRENKKIWKKEKRIFLAFALIIFVAGFLFFSIQFVCSETGSTSVSKVSISSSSSSGSYSGYESLMSGASAAGFSSGEELFDLEVIIPPAGCQPAVVRSDLLEEQNVPVFCQLVPLKINPGISISRISSVSIVQKQSNEYISGVGFHPSNSAINAKSGTSFPTTSSIGYVVVVLKKQPNEKAMPENVTTTLAASLQYGGSNGYLGKSEFYIPVMSEEEFSSNYIDYGFLDNKAYLRVESMDENSAVIGVYTSFDKKKESVTLEKGKTSKDIYLSSRTGGDGFRITLKEISIAETKARIVVNGDSFDVIKGEKFYDDKCTLRSVEAYGQGTGSVEVTCTGTSKKFELERKIDKVKLAPQGGTSQTYSLGSFVSDSYHLVYVGKVEGNNYVVVADLKDIKNKDKIEEKIKKISDNVINQVGDKKNLDDIKKINLPKYEDQNVSIEVIAEGGEGTNSKVKYQSTSASNNLVGDNTKTYFKKAISAYDKIKQTFSSSNCPAGYCVSQLAGENSKESGANALWKEYELANDLGQNEEKLQILSRIENDYPESTYNDKKPAELRGQESSLDLLSSGEKATDYDEKSGIRIELKSVNLPTNEEASVDLNVIDNGALKQFSNARFGEKLVDDARIITLTSFDEDSVKIHYKCTPTGSTGTASSSAAAQEKEKDISIAKGEEKNLISECNVRIKVNKINVKKMAHVQLNPVTTGKSRETNFTFSIGIEKRLFAMNLTPEEANSKITELNEQINDFRNITESLSELIKGMKLACMATSAYVNIKNLFFSEKGEASARKDVMASWNDLCESTKMQSDAKAKNQQECIDKNSNKIEAEIKAVASVMASWNGIEKGAKDAAKDKTGSNDNLAKKNIISSIISSVGSLELVGGGETMDANDIRGNLSALQEDKNKETLSQLSYSDLSELYLNINMANKNLDANSAEVYRNKAYSKMKEISENLKNKVPINSIKEKTGADVLIIGGKTNKDVPTGDEVKSWKDITGINHPIPNIDKDAKVIFFNYEGKNYLAVLQAVDEKIYSIKQLYDFDGQTLTKTSKNLGLRFVKGISYDNKCINCNYVKVFSTAPYKGMPAVLPFDCAKGWYVYAKQNMASGFGLGTAASKTYFDSGQLNSFFVCNVGANGLMEDMSGDDAESCRGFDIGADQPVNLLGLDEKTSKQLVERARKAVKEAQKKLASSSTEISIENCPNMKVRNSGGETGSKCTDYMSSSDCKLLYNVCDPVVCPSSRCNLGGKYTVENVIQSGIIGSTLLCLPNFIAFNPDSGVIIPVCLTGIYAGLDSWASILENYRDCINESITNNKTVGICDAINSVYMCDFFWRQAGPFVNTILENLFLGVFGNKNEGGGEYAFTSDAINNADKSVNYMQTLYGKDSKLAFGFRSITNTVVAEVCKSQASATYPDQFEAMLEPESPVQYTAYFQEESFNDAVNPPRSQYKVFYHIYAGESGHSYSVYLKDLPSYEGYSGKDTSDVASGYVAKGKYASESKDFVDVSGFKQLCIKIDLAEKCGFKSISTEFALNYAKDKAVSEMATSAVTTERDCVSGSSSLWGAVPSMNLQQAAEGVVDTKLQNYGISRVCAGKNPGYGTSAEARWKDIGYCDDKKIRCWVDENSVKNAIAGKGLEDETLSKINSTDMNNLINSGYFDTDAAGVHIKTLKKVYDNILGQITDSADISILDSASYVGEDSAYNGKTYKGRRINDLSSDVESLSSKLISTDQKIELAFYEAYIYQEVSWQIHLIEAYLSNSEENGEAEKKTEAAKKDSVVASKGKEPSVKKQNAKFYISFGDRPTDLYFELAPSGNGYIIKQQKSFLSISALDTLYPDEAVGTIINGKISFNSGVIKTEEMKELEKYTYDAASNSFVLTSTLNANPASTPEKSSSAESSDSTALSFGVLTSVSDIATWACFLERGEESAASVGKRAVAAGGTATISTISSAYSALKSVLVEPGTVLGYISGIRDRIITININGISYAQRAGSGAIEGVVTTGGNIAKLTEGTQMIRDLATGKLYSVSSNAIGKGFVAGLKVPTTATLVDATGKSLGTIEETGTLISQRGNNALKLVTPSSKIFAFVSKISAALTFYQLFCIGLETENAAFSAWDAALVAQESASAADYQLGKTVMAVESKVNELDKNYEELKAAYEGLNDNSLDVYMNEIDNEFSRMKTSLNTLKTRYDADKSNAEKGTAASEFSSDEYNYILKYVQSFRVAIIRVGEKLQALDNEIQSQIDSTQS